MKTIFSLLTALLISTIAFAQGGINYKALIKDANGDAVANQAITIQFQILEGGITNVYQETHNPTTDDNGIVTVLIGEGTVDSGNFVAIDWGSDEYFLNVQVDTGDGLTDLGSTQFTSVPYAKVAETVKKLPITNLKFPNGFEGIEGITRAMGSYTVPSGKNLYITNIRGTSTITVTRDGVQFLLSNGFFNTASNSSSTVGLTERVLTNPFLLKENDIIAGFQTGINGFLTNSDGVDPLLINLQNDYTVPNGKTLIILNYHSTSSSIEPLLINNISVYSSYDNGLVQNSSFINRLFHHSFEIPIIANEGDVVAGLSAGGPIMINGYLIDKN